MDVSQTSWVRVAAVVDIPEGGVIEIDVNNRSIALYRLADGEIFATDAYCTHGAASLADGFLDGDVIECPLHGGCFEVRTGKGLGDPIEQDLVTYRVQIAGPDVLIDLADHDSGQAR